MAETNANNLNNESFDQSYGRRVLRGGKQSQIVKLPGATTGNRFNYSNALRSNEKRKESEELTKGSQEQEDDGEGNKSNLGSKAQEAAVGIAAKTFLPPGLQGIGKSIANNVLNSSGGVSEAAEKLLKAKKMKIYLYAGIAFFSFILIIAIIFAVSSTGGTESSGAGFNEVSEYELNENYDEMPEEDNAEDSNVEVVENSEVNNNETAQ